MWNPTTYKIVRVSAVKFNEGLDSVPNDDVADDVEYEAVFVDSTSVEEEQAVKNQ